MFIHQNFSQLTGFTLTPFSRAELILLENEIECLEAEKRCKMELLKLSAETLDSSNAEYEASIVLRKTKLANVEKEFADNKKREEILKEYVNHFNSEEMLTNQLKKQVNEYNHGLWQNIKPVMDKYKSVVEETKKLKELHQKYLDLKQKFHN